MQKLVSARIPRFDYFERQTWRSIVSVNFVIYMLCVIHSTEYKKMATTYTKTTQASNTTTGQDSTGNVHGFTTVETIIVIVLVVVVTHFVLYLLCFICFIVWRCCDKQHCGRCYSCVTKIFVKPNHAGL